MRKEACICVSANMLFANGETTVVNNTGSTTSKRCVEHVKQSTKACRMMRISRRRPKQNSQSVNLQHSVTMQKLRCAEITL